MGPTDGGILLGTSSGSTNLRDLSPTDAISLTMVCVRPCPELQKQIYSHCCSYNEPTLPGSIVPTDGDIVMGASSGSTNSNDVGPTGAISPKMTK